MFAVLLVGVLLYVSSDGTVIEQTPGSHLVVSRRFMTVTAGDNTYFGDMSLTSGRYSPVLRRLENDLMFDVALYDRVTVERNGEFEVYDEGATSVVSGDKILFWVYDRSAVQFRNALTIMFNDGQDFSRFMRSLSHYTEN
ncbi:uncharacterized protein LOC132554384 [Ylistrum balloti]|uniref:uncharacterized protein LOC132554384 n=1 Tax=Ylistrum balloti TaxID=509963 RepID=UPI002905EC1D|nr:uncharacterized protein LOC132554384 [Ylistrum balloti]